MNYKERFESICLAYSYGRINYEQLSAQLKELNKEVRDE
jgi:hypothetical protein